MDPVCLLFSAVERSVFEYGQSVLQAETVRNLPYLYMVSYMVLKLPAVHVGYSIYDQMIMDRVGVQVRSDKHLKPVTPHSVCCFNAYPVCFLRSYFIRLKALKAMIGYIAAAKTEPFLYSQHIFVCMIFGAVDPGDIHLLIGLIVV